MPMFTIFFVSFFFFVSSFFISFLRSRFFIPSFLMRVRELIIAMRSVVMRALLYVPRSSSMAWVPSCEGVRFDFVDVRDAHSESSWNSDFPVTTELHTCGWVRADEGDSEIKKIPSSYLVGDSVMMREEISF